MQKSRDAPVTWQNEARHEVCIQGEELHLFEPSISRRSLIERANAPNSRIAQGTDNCSSGNRGQPDIAVAHDKDIMAGAWGRHREVVDLLRSGLHRWFSMTRETLLDPNSFLDLPEQEGQQGHWILNRKNDLKLRVIL